ncbi:adenosine deaminase [Cnuella takakiae]|uniref:adenosine deaminase n=1 Tax=Cnuella takakiae TaxID=1302690 RepID=A0A1M5ACD4_9BACT|nr:adenosine deaminase [Cnuella takakiae]OLY92020.1 adenosine deaminase [Cnuella takakiae]SHF27757.1 adenosine deaminase [Cnuella takakiae]
MPSLPKVELHLHLDCSLTYKVVQQLAPQITYEQYRESFIAPPKCTDLADYITRAIRGFELMQTKEQLRLVTLDLMEQLQADHVLYAEIRYAPLQHVYEGLQPEEVVQAVNEAVLEGMTQTGVQAGMILCTLRHYTGEQSLQTVKLVEHFKGSPVVGFDIAADEAGFPITNHIAAFQYARKKGIPCTAHAGEARGADSVWETLNHFHPSRIGHGVRSVEDPALLQHLKAHNIHLEVCPTSNVQTNVVDRIENHPADRLYKAGVSMSINTDARTISDTTLEKEYQIMQQQFGWEKAHFLKCNLEAIEHSFAPEAVKATVKKKLLAGFSAAI